MNAALLYSQEEIEAFVVTTARDSFGTYHILTGYEGKGDCFWCGKDFEGKRKRYCKGQDLDTDETAHWRQYHQHFTWAFARDWCNARYNHACANCSAIGSHWANDHFIRGEVLLEVHHIIPLEGESRQWTPYNLPWNLICLCHGCHLDIHAAMRVDAHDKFKATNDVFKLAIERGQGVFNLEGVTL